MFWEQWDAFTSTMFPKIAIGLSLECGLCSDTIAPQNKLKRIMNPHATNNRFDEWMP